MRKVLIPVDMSEASEAALRYAVECPCSVTKKMILLHVIDPLDIKSLGVVGMADREEEMRQELLTEAQQHLEELAKKYAREGILFKTRILFDRPWRGIINAAIEEHVDHIVMGSHGRGQVAELLLGSVAERVMRNAPVPVTIIRPRDVRERLVQRWNYLSKE